LYPLLFQPAYKEYVWGGTNLGALTGRPLGGRAIAESWEIAAHPDGSSMVSNGFWQGISLRELYGLLGPELAGRYADRPGAPPRFPLLVKLLDASRPLSVQVHPTDAFALEHGLSDSGKSEMWLILHSTPDARIVLGFSERLDRARFRAALAVGELERYLNVLPVAAGDHVCVPSGTLHALLGGVVLIEVQQSSNLTYRVHDWGRDRPLHVEQALQAVDFSAIGRTLDAAQPEPAGGPGVELLCANPHFEVRRVTLGEGGSLTGSCDGRTLEVWGVVAGAITVSTGRTETPVERLRFALLPAQMGPYAINSAGGATLLHCRLAPPRSPGDEEGPPFVAR
jgi:mannose-6-phosphate isomerase